MSSWTKFASAFILSRGVGASAVKAATFCLISGDAAKRPFSRFQYQVPISRQLLNPFAVAPPDGNNERIICPCRPCLGGICSSYRTPFTSLTTHCHWLLPVWVGVTSGWFNHEALYSQPAGSCKE